MGDNKVDEARLTHGFIQPWLVILGFGVSSWKRRSVVIFADSADADAVRRLRAHLTAATDSL